MIELEEKAASGFVPERVVSGAGGIMRATMQRAITSMWSRS